METLESCFDKADYLIQEAEQSPLPESKRSIPSTKWKSFRKKVRETYAKSLTKPTKGNLRPTSNILSSLVKDMNGARLLINLFPVSEGYSITLMKSDGTCAENLHLPYEENEILDYIDNEELPPMLVDTLHRNHNNAFVSGSVLAEVRDYRIASDETTFETNYVLLKPTQQTIQNDVNLIAEETSSTYKWGIDDKLALESVLTLATAEPLCLDVSPTVAIVKNKLQARKKMFNTIPLRKHIRRNGTLARKRAELYKSRPAPSSLKLHDFLKERKKLKKDNSSGLASSIKLPVTAVDVWRKSPLELAMPEDVDTSKHVNVFKLPEGGISNEDIIEVQSILLESEGVNRDVCSRITIGQRPRDMHYFGMLQSNKYFKQSMIGMKDMNQIFSLGTEHRANLYILQYQELFTEDGRSPAKVTVKHVGQNAAIYHIPNQQQPWQLAQEKSAYSVGSVINIPITKWKKMNIPTKYEVKSKPQQTAAAIYKQIQKPQVQIAANTTQLSSTTPTLNAITLQNSSQSSINFPVATPSTNRRLAKVKSNPGPDGAIAQIQALRRARASSDFQNIQSRATLVTAQSPIPDNSQRILTTKNVSNVAGQTFTMNSSALATALGQIGGTGAVQVQVPVMTVNSQRASNGSSQDGQIQGNQTTAVIRMPVAIGGSTTTSGQITALNLLSGGQNVLDLGNIQLTGGGGITIPASQLPANIAMQLTSIANANSQPISLISSSNAPTTHVQPQQISLVGQSGTTTPIAIVANNDNWQVQDSSTNQQTYTIAPRTQITSRPIQQQQQVQVVQQLRIPAHLLSQLTGSSEQVQQLIAAATASKNSKRRSTAE
uniref:transcription factor SPT20 homolog n=1 Tax=Styela clava TaxID=7725 RepID=UPI00193A0146|nr:transcription factor SPT20 homolog [Styela clava]